MAKLRGAEFGDDQVSPVRYQTHRPEFQTARLSAGGTQLGPQNRGLRAVCVVDIIRDYPRFESGKIQE